MSTRRVIALLTVAALAVSSVYARSHFEIDWSAASVRTLVQGYGGWGPFVYVVLVAFRLVLLVPSQVVLVAGGVCFGFAWGALYGTLGLSVSGAIAFVLARVLGAELSERKVPPRLRALFRTAGARAGAIVVAVATGHPVGPMTAVHVGAGLTAMSYAVFGVALVVGAASRAVLFTYLGNSLVEGGFWTSWPVLVPMGLMLLPLLHGPTRHKVARLMLLPRESER